MLGFENAILAYSSAEFGKAKGKIWLDEVQCVGTETELGDCIHLAWGTHDCQHYEDAGVSCTSKCLSVCWYVHLKYLVCY